VEGGGPSANLSLQSSARRRRSHRGVADLDWQRQRSGPAFPLLTYQKPMALPASTVGCSRSRISSSIGRRAIFRPGRKPIIRGYAQQLHGEPCGAGSSLQSVSVGHEAPECRSDRQRRFNLRVHPPWPTLRPIQAPRPAFAPSAKRCGESLPVRKSPSPTSHRALCERRCSTPEIQQYANLTRMNIDPPEIISKRIVTAIKERERMSTSDFRSGFSFD